MTWVPSIFWFYWHILPPTPQHSCLHFRAVSIWIISFLKLDFKKFIYSFLTDGSWLLQGRSLVVASQGYSLIALCRLLTVVASRVAEHRL